MNIIKCKMCGGDMKLSPDKSLGICEYCGSTMTLPKVGDQQRAAAFDRGNHFRRVGEFDKALSVYERIIMEDEDDAEAHWCCALCRFGIEYVQDPASGEYLPTCQRASFDSFLEDVDYRAALNYADAVAREQYQKDGEQIAAVQRGILATVQKEEPFDVFLCYKESREDGQRTVDSTLAQDIYYRLTEQGRRVFFARITLEDKAGQEYEPYIFAALHSARVMVVVGTRPEYLNAVWVKNEWSRYLALMKQDRKRLLIPCYRDMDPYDLPEQLSVLQAYDMGEIGFIQDLIRGVAKVLDGEKKPEPKEEEPDRNEGNVSFTALLKRGYMSLEDHEWKKADDFFEQVLNLDAECAQAYFGKALAARQCASAQEFAQKEKKVTTPGKGASLVACPENEEVIAAAVREYQIPGFLTEDMIRGQFQKFNRNYESAADARRRELEKKREALAADKLLVRTERYAKDAFAEEFREIQKEISDAYELWVKRGGEKDAERAERVTEKYAEFLEKTKESIAQQYNARQEEMADSYASACKVLEEAGKDTEDVEKAQASVIKLRQAARQLRTLDWYKDSLEQAEKCEQEAGRIDQEVRVELERLRALRDKEYERESARRRKISIIKGVTVVTVIVIALVITQVIIPENEYRGAERLLAEGNYEEAIAGFVALEDYRDAAERALQTKYEWAEKLEESGESGGAAIVFGELGDYKDAKERGQDIWSQYRHEVIAVGNGFVIGLKSNGKAIGVGENNKGQCDVNNWTDIVAVSAGENHAVGLKSDGTVMAAGRGAPGQCNVGDWTDIIAVSAGKAHTVGLKSNGTVIAVGSNKFGQCNVDDWTDIVEVYAKDDITVGLKSDGSVMFTGTCSYDVRGLSAWENITAIAIGNGRIVGLKSDGSVVAVGYGQINVKNWENIVAISAGKGYTVGLKSDGMVLAVGKIDDEDLNKICRLKNIVAVFAGDMAVVGLRSNGTTAIISDREDVRRNVSQWTDIKIPQ